MTDTIETILLATIEYNKSIHSVTKKNPLEIIHSATSELRSEIKNRLIESQKNLLSFHSKNKQKKTYEVGRRVFVKNNKRLGNKLSPLYEEGTVQVDMGTTILIKGRVVHKDNLRD